MPLPFVPRSDDEHIIREYFVKTEGSVRTVDEWKAYPEQHDNHWLDCLVGTAVDFVLHRLLAVRPCANFDARRDSRCSHCMNTFMALLDGGEHIVPVAFNVGAVRVKLVRQPCFLKQLLALGDMVSDRDTSFAIDSKQT